MVTLLQVDKVTGVNDMEDGKYVLIVDDDPDARKILAKIIEGLELRTRSVADGEVALAVIAEEKPALILLDLMMPGMDGFEVLAYLRRIRIYRYIPVIVVSAVSQTDLLQLPGVAVVIRKAHLRATQVQEHVLNLLGSEFQGASQ